MTQRPPVTDWTSDFDVLDPEYIDDPFSIWDDLPNHCPIAHTDRRGGAWLSHDLCGRHRGRSRHRDVQLPRGGSHRRRGEGEEGERTLPYGLPPISADPPLHTWTRRLLLPWFSHTRVEGYEAMTRDLCRRLIDGFADTDGADAAADYAQQIPVRVIATILGVPEDLSDTFTGWVRDVLEFADEPDRVKEGAGAGILTFLIETSPTPQG